MRPCNESERKIDILENADAYDAGPVHRLVKLF